MAHPCCATQNAREWLDSAVDAVDVRGEEEEEGVGVGAGAGAGAGATLMLLGNKLDLADDDLDRYWTMHVCVCVYPTNNQRRLHAKLEAQSEHVHVACTFFARLGADVHAQSVIIDKKFLHRSSGGSLLRVLCWLGSSSTT